MPKQVEFKQGTKMYYKKHTKLQFQSILNSENLYAKSYTLSRDDGIYGKIVT